MKSYLKYKDSGVEWLGKIPEHWKVGRMTNFGEFTASGIDKKIEPNEQLVFMVNYTDIYGNKTQEISADRSLMQVSCPKGKTESCNLLKGDLVFTPSSETKEDIGLSALINEDLPNTVFSYHTIRFRFGQIFNHRFKKYLCNNYFVLNQFSRFSKGTTRQILVRDDFKNIRVILPTLEEQQAIADFLDHKTGLIDNLIEKKKRQIELLKEQRTAIINQAVTKGLDPNVKMKDSGIEWLGKIPEHWEVKKIKYCVITNKESLTEETDPNYLFKYIDIGNVNQNGFINAPEEITFKESPSRARRVVNQGDTIISTVRTYLKAIAFIGSDEIDLIVSTGFAVLTPQQSLLPKYLYYLVSCEKIIDTIMSLSTGVSYPAINSSELISIPLWFPPSVKEQAELIQYIENENSKIKNSVQKAENQIQLLQEYRTALISEAVTGKIDVRKVV